jgi:hypothetical protein
MLKAFSTCAALVLRSWSGITGATTALVGALKNVGLEAIPIPAWAWWLAAIILLFYTAVRLQMSLLEEQAKNRNPEPSMRLEDAVKRIRGKDDVFGANDSEDRDREVMRALTLIRERASSGSLAIFGSKEVRFYKPADREIALSRMPIPKGFWEAYELDCAAFKTNRDGITKPTAKPDDRSTE